jgi:hypothetical protein
VVVGAKADLSSYDVSSAEAAVAAKHELFKVSSKQGINVHTSFIQLAEKIFERLRP